MTNVVRSDILDNVETRQVLEKRSVVRMTDERKVFETPNELKYDDLKYGFPKGAVILYEYPGNRPGYANIYAVLDREETKENIDAYLKIVHKRFRSIVMENLQVMKLSEVTPTRLRMKDPTFWKGNLTDFWLDKDGVIREQCERVQRVMQIPQNLIYLFYILNEKTKEVSYLGYSTQKSDTDIINSDIKGTRLACTYGQFLKMRVSRLKRTEEKKYPWDEVKSGETKYPWDKAEAKETEPSENELEPDLFDEYDIYDDEPDEEMELETSEIPANGWTMMRKSVKTFLEKTPFSEMLSYVEARVKGQPELSKVLAGVYYYMQCIAERRPFHSNILLAAPSGCGKTETYRALRDFFEEKIPGLPVVQCDMTSITEEGFKGPDTADIVKPLLNVKEPDGIGIVFMDEFDKKLSPSFTSGGNNVNSAVQAQILTLIEGRKVENQGHVIDTNNTLFIGLGSFDACRAKRETKHGGLGFGATAKVEQADHYHPISRQEMIDLGASYELLGRFQVIANYYRLPRKMVNEIIDEHVDKISGSIGYSIQITEAFREQLLKEANGKYGCRMLENMLVDSTMQILAELYMKNVCKKTNIIVLDTDGQARIKKKNTRAKDVAEKRIDRIA